jgi:hypothetical protein
MPDFEFLNSHDKIYYWKNFRETILKLETNYDAALATQTFWEKRGRVKWNLDYDNPSKWPTPWEIINENVYCRSTLAVMMFYTLYYSDDHYWKDKLVLKLVEDKETNETYIILAVCNRWILNKSYACIEDLTKISEDDLYIIKASYKKNKHNFEIVQ